MNGMPGKRGDRARRGLSRFDVVAVIVVIAIEPSEVEISLVS
ncbi:MAG: hypothetical protein ACYS1B_16660 [Planctomycetota bacterium]|jgi:hypothetical protein